MSIGFKAQPQLVSGCVNGLSDPETMRSIVVVMPPGFGEDAVADQIVTGLRRGILLCVLRLLFQTAARIQISLSKQSINSSRMEER